MGGIFLEVTVIIVVAAIFSVASRLLKQPPILAYLLAGIFLGPFGKFNLESTETLRAMGEIGITLLLFMLGLELKLSELRSISKTALLVGGLQIVFTSASGYVLATALGFSQITALYFAIALTFASTIIVVKLLSDKKDLASLFGKLTVGVLLVQDFFAIFIVMFLSTFGAGSQVSFDFVASALFRGALFLGATILVGKLLLGRLLDLIARSQEVLFLASLAWVFALSALAHVLSFPIEIGGFLAGLALAQAMENFQIVAKVRPLRDFFITIFFVVLGMEMVFSPSSQTLVSAASISLFVLVGKPLLVMAIMGFLGHRKRTSFLVGTHTTQISEFSLIIVFLGHRLGHVDADSVSLITLVSIITFATSTYIIVHANALYRRLSPFLGVFEKETLLPGEEVSSELARLRNHIVLVGGSVMGQSILKTLVEEGEKVVVIDFDPDVVRRLRAQNLPCIFGDVVDTDIQQQVALEKARLIVSTVSDIEDNMLLIEGLKTQGFKGKIIVIGEDRQEALELHEKGADYVVLPHLAAGKHVARLLRENSVVHKK